jgi:hypothetical protein
VQALDRQLQQYAPLDEHICLTDVGVPGVKCVALQYNWPKWFAKMEMFRPDITDNILFMDLDTVIVGPLDDILKQTKLTMLRDFYRDGKKRPEGLQSSLMFIPEAERAAVWDDWITDTKFAMQACGYRGDQYWLEAHWLKVAARWQDVVPKQVVSWKVHCKDDVPADARIICFHGQPRPWGVTKFKDLYRW